MKTIKYKVVDTSTIDIFMRCNYVMPYIEMMQQEPFGYEFVESDDPVYIFCSEYGYNKFSYDCVRILITSEVHSLDFTTYDYTLGTENIDYEDRYCRLLSLYPIFGFEKDFEFLNDVRKNKMSNLEKTIFCSFIYSNPHCYDRNRFFALLNRYKNIMSAGHYNNNIGRYYERDWQQSAARWPYDDNIAILSKCKFNIAFENFTNIDSYITEKIMLPFFANCIPIYYGAYNVADYFNPKAFINCHEFSSFEEAIERIIEIDNNDDLYYDMLRQPIFTAKQANYHKNHYRSIQAFLHNIFKQDVGDAFRRPRFDYIRRHEKYLYDHRVLIEDTCLSLAHERLLREKSRYKHIIKLINSSDTDSVFSKFYNKCGYSNIMYYGYGEVTRYILRQHQPTRYNVVGLIDNASGLVTPKEVMQNSNNTVYTLYSPYDLEDMDAAGIDAIVVTVTEDFEEISQFLLTVNKSLNIISLDSILDYD